MHIAAITICVLLIITAIAQATYVLLFARGLARELRPLLEDSDCGKAAIIICLRGSDPFLEKCLVSLLEQDYPEFKVHIIVDHSTDPAWDHVYQATRDRGNYKLHTLDSPLATCSLKCSSLLQVIETLDSEVEFIALADADTVPQQDWLRRLATELKPAQVGAVTGIRWYAPDDMNWGSLVRHVWNSAAIVQMYLYGIAWGGTLAIKLKSFRQLNFAEQWSKEFCEDTMIKSGLQAGGQQLVTCPGLVMPNRESCDLSGFFAFVQRQLLTTRLYHRAWWLVVFHGVSLGVFNLVAVSLLVLSLLQRNWGCLGLVALGLTIFHIANYGLLAVIKQRVDLRLGNRKSDFTIPQLLRLVIAIPLTIFVHATAVAKTVSIREVTWRGIRYRIEPNSAIRLRNYQTMNETETQREESESL